MAEEGITMLGLQPSELFIVLIVSLLRFVIPVLLAVFLGYRLWSYLKRRDGLKRSDAVSGALGTAPSESPSLLVCISAHGLDDELAARGLSERERTVLQGVCAGKTLAALAEELGVSRSTVGTYCTRAYEKLGVDSKEAVQKELARLSCKHLLAAAGLSEREAEVAAFAADDVSVADIAAELVLSEATVSSHLQHAYAKLGVHSRSELLTMLRKALR